MSRRSYSKRNSLRGKEEINKEGRNFPDSRKYILEMQLGFKNIYGSLLKLALGEENI